MEALSPRSVNLPPRTAKVGGKEKPATTKPAVANAAAQLKSHKKKDLAPEPPAQVFEPVLEHGRGGEQYTIQRMLGKGGFALCYSAQLKRDPSRVFALKMVKAKFSMKKMEDKFRTELQIHSKMHHPNIVEFFRAFTYHDVTYVVLELCENGSIMEMVKRRGYLSVPEVRRFTIQMCGAIKYMHDKNVIHRDLKMGNLFLDKNMNLKIGDFGLAAILVTDKDIKGPNRRTTMCGTPNYIAPEILQKNLGGHDHKVDIWAIGIIIYAMLTGRPPFQSSTQEEIYKRVKHLDYDWPAEDSGEGNHIPFEVKDLVKALLQVNAEYRPEPDIIVMHPFFDMYHGCIAPVLSPACRKEKPAWLVKSKARQGDVIKKNMGINREDFLKECGVGIPAGENDALSYPTRGIDVGVSVYIRCLEEESFHRTPIVPLPEDAIYQSYLVHGDWLNQTGQDFLPLPRLMQAHKQKERFDTVEALEKKADGNVVSAAASANTWPAPNITMKNEVLSNTWRSDPALAQQHGNIAERLPYRAPNPPSRASVLREESVKGKRPVSGLLGSEPIRPRARAHTRAIEIAEDQFGEHGRGSRVGMSLRNRQIQPLVETANKISKEVAEAKATHSHDFVNAIATEPAEVHEPKALKEINVENKLTMALRPRLRNNNINDQANFARPSKSQLKKSVFIAPNETAEWLPDTDSQAVNNQLRHIARQLEAALFRKSSSKLTRRAAKVDDRPVVVKWVDYTNKFGIGYILNDGSVGCLFLGGSPRSQIPTSILVRGGEDHLLRRKLKTYSQVDFLIPRDCSPVEFYENHGEAGFKRVRVAPKNLHIEDPARHKGASADPCAKFTDNFDAAKTRALWLWDKFGSYMSKALGPVEEGQYSKRRYNGKVAPWVKFYQRLGNVGIWVFGDGTLQFNFPDHTKVVVSGDGLYCDFYHLLPDIARQLRETGHLPDGALNARSCQSHPLDFMCSPHHHDTRLAEILETNGLREKLDFLLQIVKVWIANGGYGAGCDQKDLYWDGMMEEEKRSEKKVWTTVGAVAGDYRKEVRAKRAKELSERSN